MLSAISIRRRATKKAHINRYCPERGKNRHVPRLYANCARWHGQRESFFSRLYAHRRPFTAARVQPRTCARGPSPRTRRLQSPASSSSVMAVRLASRRLSRSAAFGRLSRRPARTSSWQKGDGSVGGSGGGGGSYDEWWWAWLTVDRGGGVVAVVMTTAMIKTTSDVGCLC